MLPLGVSRNFTCTSPPGPGYIIAWGVNGTSVTSPQFQDYIVLGEEVYLENGGIQRNLTYKADARANNTHIFCAVTNTYNGEHMVAVNMNCTLQGKLVSELIN